MAYSYNQQVQQAEMPNGSLDAHDLFFNVHIIKISPSKSST